MLVDQEILRHIWEQRPLLGVKAGLPVQEFEDTKGRFARTCASGIHARVRGAARG
jgi:hypothetical protein